MQMQRPSSVVWQLDGYPEITGQHLVKRNPGGTPDAKVTRAALAARFVSF